MINYINKICKQCLCEFAVTLTNKNRIFCSKKCYSLSMIKEPKIRHCLSCNKEYICKNITEEQKYGYGKFCSRKCSKYSINENYFHTIDSSEKAYWLGMLLSDGNVYKNTLTLKLMLSDYDHVVKFQKALEAEQPIRCGKNYASFSTNNKKLCEDLLKFNMIPRKSLIVDYPIIEPTYNKDFIRGYFDGDGCISFDYKTPKYKRFSIFSGSKKIISKIKKIIEDEVGIEINQSKCNGGFSINTAKKINIEKLFHYLYNASTIHLERKFIKFIQQ